MSATPPDSELVHAARGGDDAALRLLLERHLPSVYTLCVRYLGNEADAQDASQEAFLKVWRNLGKFDPERSFRTWILTIAKNAATDLMRKRRPIAFSQIEKENENLLEDTLPDPEPLPEEIFARAALAEEVRTALRTLPSRSRTLLSLRYEEVLSFEEIGRVLDLPAATVRSIHHRALAALRTVLMKNRPTET